MLSLPPLFVCALTVLFDYNIAKILNADSYAQLRSSASTAAGYVDGNVAAFVGRAQSISNLVSGAGGEDKAGYGLLKAAALANGISTADLYTVNSSGIATDCAGKSFELSEEPFYLEFRKTRSLTVTDVIRHVGTGDRVITVYLSTEIGTKALCLGLSAPPDECIGDLSAVTGLGTVAVINKNGKFISGTGEAENFFSAFSDPGDINETFDMKTDIAKGTQGQCVLTVGGRRSLVTYMPLTENGDWSLVSVLDLAEVSHGTDSVIFLASALCLFIGGVIVFCAILIIRYRLKKEKQLVAEQERLRKSEEMYRIVGEMSDNIIFEGDLKTGILKFNKMYKKVFGGIPLITNLNTMSEDNPFVHKDDMAAFVEAGRKMLFGVPEGAAEFRIMTAEGTMKWFRLEFVTVGDGEVPEKIVGKFTVVEDDAHEDTHPERHRIDRLTKLLLKETFEEKVNAYLSSAGGDKRHALLLIDADDFKNVNDSYGHKTGDRMLAAIAEKINAVFYVSDITGRIGGDKFAVLMTDIPFEEVVIRKAGLLCASVHSTVIETDCDIDISCSIGIAYYEGLTDSYPALYKKSAAALASSKASGKNKYTVSE